MGRGARVSGDTEPGYEIRVQPAAAREYRRLQGPLRDRIQSVIDSLANDPRPVGAAKLAGGDDFRVGVGDYRVVCAVDDAERLVIIARIAHRREVYRR